MSTLRDLPRDRTTNAFLRSSIPHQERVTEQPLSFDADRERLDVGESAAWLLDLFGSHALPGSSGRDRRPPDLPRRGRPDRTRRGHAARTSTAPGAPSAETATRAAPGCGRGPSRSPCPRTAPRSGRRRRPRAPAQLRSRASPPGQPPWWRPARHGPTPRCAHLPATPSLHVLSARQR